MSERVTVSRLRAIAARINRMMGAPEEPYKRDEAGNLRAQVGNHHISQQYGGYCLHRMCNESGGVTTPVTPGHVPARELYGLLHAYIRGLEDGQRLARKEA